MKARGSVSVLCLASYHKGEEFLRECKRLGARVLLLTAEKLRGAGWPRESIDEVFYIPDLFQRDHGSGDRHAWRSTIMPDWFSPLSRPGASTRCSLSHGAVPARLPCVDAGS